MSNEQSDVQESGPRYLDGSGPEEPAIGRAETDTAPPGALPGSMGMSMPGQRSPGGSPMPPFNYAHPQPYGGPPPVREEENTSGMMGDVPPQVERMGFHWGACLLSTYWAKEHGINGLATIQGAVMAAWVVSGFLARVGVPGAWIVRVVCLVAVPALSYYFGRIGYREAWRYKRYPGGVKEYLEDQRQWTRRSFIIAPSCLAAIAGLLFFIFHVIEANTPGGSANDDTPPPVSSTISAPASPVAQPSQPAASDATPPPPPPSSGGTNAHAKKPKAQAKGSSKKHASATTSSEDQPDDTPYDSSQTDSSGTQYDSGGADSQPMAPQNDAPAYDQSAPQQAPPQSSTGTDTGSPPAPDPNSAPPATYQSGQPVDNSGAPAQ